MPARNTLATCPRPRRSLTQKLGAFLAGVALAAGAVSFSAQAQTFKAMPLDCGGWFSGFAQADNGRLYGYGDVFGAWRSDDGGMNWSYLNWSIPGGDFYGTGMAVQKNNADVVYYCTDKALSKSTNGGTSWTVLLNDVGPETPRFRGASPILVRSNDPNEIWFAGPRKGQTGWLWKSSNGGTDWVKAGGSAFDSNRARTLHNVAAFANQVWVGSDNGLFVSTDGGNTFSLVGGSGRLPNVGMIARFTTGSLAGVGLVTRSNSSGTSGGISRITATNYNNASTYTVTDAAAPNLGYPSGLQIFSDGSSSAWNVGADRHAFSPAGDGGQTFTLRATTLKTDVVPIWTTAAEMAARNTPGGGTDQVIEAAGNPNKWLITGGKGPMYSLDKGLSWQYFPSAGSTAGVKTYYTSVSRYDANRVYIPVSDQGSFIVTDGGSSGLAALGSRKTYNHHHNIFRVLEGPNTQNLVLAGVDQSTNTTLILKSGNGGTTWSPVPQAGNGLPLSRDGITKSVMSFTDANDFLVVLASATGQAGTVTPGTINPGVWRTTNGGTSFTQVADLPTTGLKTGHRYDPLNCFIERDAVQADVRYFVARDASFYRSANGGTNWTARTHPFNMAWVWGLHADPVRGGNLWAAGDYAGVKVSRDGGQSWNATAQYMNARFVSSYDGKIAVFGSMAGDTQPRLYYSTDDGANFTALTTPARNFHAVQGLAVDRNGKVWVSWNSVTVVTPPAPTLTSAQAPTAQAQASAAVHVYPNPAAGSFSVITGRDGARITVTTLEGKAMRTVTATGTVTTIDAGSWQAGMYLVRIQSGTETTTRKVVITK
ncbi:MAG TPA: T9SS type A sorting domain-containing protein [Hymenobacter sp.]